LRNEFTDGWLETASAAIDRRSPAFAAIADFCCFRLSANAAFVRLHEV